MKLIATDRHRTSFAPLHATATSQAAMMTLEPGEATGEGGDNEHPWAEQWLFVVSGSGEAKSGKRTYKLRVGSLLLIEKGEPHLIRNSGKVPLVTVNIYAPPAYGDDGEPLY